MSHCFTAHGTRVRSPKSLWLLSSNHDVAHGNREFVTRRRSVVIHFVARTRTDIASDLRAGRVRRALLATSAAHAQVSAPMLSRSINQLDATALVVGIIIGAIVFVQPSVITGAVPTVSGVPRGLARVPASPTLFGALHRRRSRRRIPARLGRRTTSF